MYDTLRELHRKFWKELPIPKLERCSGRAEIATAGRKK